MNNTKLQGRVQIHLLQEKNLPPVTGRACIGEGIMQDDVLWARGAVLCCGAAGPNVRGSWGVLRARLP